MRRASSKRDIGAAVAVASLAAAVGVVSMIALAVPSVVEASPATARASWARGKQLLAQKKGPEAVEALEAAASEDPSVLIQLDLARALVLVGALEEAHVLLDALRADTNRTVALTAKKLDDEVLARLPKLTVKTDDDDVIITVNGRALEPNVGMPLDPGRYELEVRREGEVVLKRKLTLVERERKSVEVEPAEGRRADETAGRASRSGGTYLPAALAYATSGAGLTLGAIVGVMAFDATKEVETACGGPTCVGDYGDEIDRANTLAHLSTGSFVVGAVGLGLGLTFTFTLGPGDDDEEAEPSVVTAFVDGPSAGLRVRFD